MWEKLDFYTTQQQTISPQNTNNLSDMVVSSPHVWYLMDEVGSAISHSEDPNFRCVPFLYGDAIKNASFSVIWPVKDVHQSQVVTRNFYPSSKEKIQRNIKIQNKNKIK